MTNATPMFTKDQLLDMGDGTFTIALTDEQRKGLYRTGRRLPDPEAQPAQPGDVLSVQPGGFPQTRIQGTTGPFERCTVDGHVVVFRPQGIDAYYYPLALTSPNV